VQVTADWQQLPSQALADTGNDAHAAVASNPTASAPSRIIFFITIFLSRGGFGFANGSHVRRRQILKSFWELNGRGN
jgi:hypothetical protein